MGPAARSQVPREAWQAVACSDLMVCKWEPEKEGERGSGLQAVLLQRALGKP